jgi:Fic family protein
MTLNPHIPKELPPIIDYMPIIRRIADANRDLGALNSIWLHPAINPQLLITPLLTKEAVASSKIEGTVATIEDVYRYEAEERTDMDNNISRDSQEIINYRLALQESLKILKTRPIGENLIKNAHSILLNSVRGEDMDRGNFRKRPVFIGKEGSDISQASYIPPPTVEIPRLFKNWEGYINSQTEPDPLVQIAIAHYQFEAIHPFNDGNGRIGRLIIPLFLCGQGLLTHPILYISGYIEENRDYYIKCLRHVDKYQDWIPWIEFMLSAIRIQALKTEKLALTILNCHKALSEDVDKIPSPYSRKLLDILFMHPIVSVGKIKGVIGAKSPQTIYNLLDKFKSLNIIEESGDKKRNRVFVFRQLLDLL